MTRYRRCRVLAQAERRLGWAGRQADHHEKKSQISNCVHRTKRARAHGACIENNVRQRCRHDARKKSKIVQRFLEKRSHECTHIGNAGGRTLRARVANPTRALGKRDFECDLDTIVCAQLTRSLWTPAAPVRFRYLYSGIHPRDACVVM